jgi:phosphatidylserine/phosphatidylglycerophosphate/cardiolipin synthase-like enzyme
MMFRKHSTLLAFLAAVATSCGTATVLPPLAPGGAEPPDRADNPNPAPPAPPAPPAEPTAPTPPAAPAPTDNDIAIGDIDDESADDPTWGAATSCKSLPTLTPLREPTITISVRGLTLRLRDSASDFERVYPIGAGRIDANRESKSLIPVRSSGGDSFRVLDVDPCKVWLTLPNTGARVPVFAGLPFIRFYEGYAIHGPIDNFRNANGGALRRGYVSDGAIRMEASDLVELTSLIGGAAGAVGVPIQILRDIERDAEGRAIDIPARWIGSECRRDSDCNYAGGKCQIVTVTGTGTCTAACERYCLYDKYGYSETYCIEAEPNRTGMCAMRASPFNADCERFEGLSKTTRVRHTAGTDVSVCFGNPSAQPPIPNDPALNTPRVLLHTLDIWGQPLPTSAKVMVAKNGVPVATYGFPVVNFLLEPGTYTVTIAAPYHHQLDLTFSHDDSAAARSAPLALTLVRNGPGHGVSQSRELRVFPPLIEPVAVFNVFLGLRHAYFAAEGRPARAGNDIQLLMDGEETWHRVWLDLVRAQTSVLISTWMWDSTFELLRDAATHHLLSPTGRATNTILSLLEASPAYKRVLVNQIGASDSIVTGWLTTDMALRAHGPLAGDRFEYMGQVNDASGRFRMAPRSFRFVDRVRANFADFANRAFDPEDTIASPIAPRMVDLTSWPVTLDLPHASHHQKFMVLDGTTAFVGGMNYRPTDWDSSAHRVFDHRRMPFSASQSDRAAVMAKSAASSTGPRKDYMVRVKGPAVQDVAEVFKARWDTNLARGTANSQYASTFALNRSLATYAGGSAVQVTTTMPDPWNEHSILESWLNAVSQAKSFIYIEDQYFRSTVLIDAITARMIAVPDLKLVVITKTVSEWTDPACFWSARLHSNLKARFPGRYRLYQLRAFDTAPSFGIDETAGAFADIDVHSKMLIIDDLYMSVGSANKNNRGVFYESEMNLAIVDPVWVKNARRRIFANLFGSASFATDDVAVWWNYFDVFANWNDYVKQNWSSAWGDLNLNGAPLPASYEPRGFLYNLDFRDPSYCLIEAVGEDMT